MAEPWRDRVRIGECTLYLGDCMEIVPLLEPVDHVFCDPAYEKITHDAKNSKRKAGRTDGKRDLQGLDFPPIDEIREPFVAMIEDVCQGWFAAFCTSEGIGRWADVINASAMKYKRACHWIKPDGAPQLNGQGPAQGAEHFVTAWAGKGYARWNAGGKRGVYTHLVNPPDRHGGHPTEKPWRLMVEILKDFTNPGETILDTFMGSGTTGVACVKLGRKFIGIEMIPEYFEMARRRIEAEHRQTDMFMQIPQIPKARQEKLNLEAAE